MKYVQLIYNPVAGTRKFKNHLDYIYEVFQTKDRELRVYRTTSSDDFETIFDGRDLTDCQAILVAGGDGSLSRVVNALEKKKVKIPVGVIPAGTANDFAKHLAIPQDLDDAIEVYAPLQASALDLGVVNDRYFINVCSGGLLVNISQKVESEMKDIFGKLAYYIKGVQELPKFRSLSFQITANGRVYNEQLFFFLALNGSSAGGFNRIGEAASMKDGMLEFIAVRACPPNDMLRIFGKILRGDHLNDKDILYFKCPELTIECLEEEMIPSDVDGEPGPEFPLHIKVLPKEFKILVNPEKANEKNKSE